MQPRAEPTVARWMTFVLGAAGVYNLIWGGCVVLSPQALFRWAGLPPINYPVVWQCVGMIVALYGVGYLIAARDPVRHWPIVLVGLLGKILGPLGMASAVSRGTLPVTAIWVCVANDAVWWIPFGWILSRAWTVARHARREPGGTEQRSSSGAGAGP
jgi:hypothetical protein